MQFTAVTKALTVIALDFQDALTSPVPSQTFVAKFVFSCKLKSSIAVEFEKLNAFDGVMILFLMNHAILVLNFI